MRYYLGNSGGSYPEAPPSVMPPPGVQPYAGSIGPGALPAGPTPPPSLIRPYTSALDFALRFGAAMPAPAAPTAATPTSAAFAIFEAVRLRAEAAQKIAAASSYLPEVARIVATARPPAVSAGVIGPVGAPSAPVGISPGEVAVESYEVTQAAKLPLRIAQIAVEPKKAIERSVVEIIKKLVKGVAPSELDFAYLRAAGNTASDIISIAAKTGIGQTAVERLIQKAKTLTPQAWLQYATRGWEASGAIPGVQTVAKYAGKAAEFVGTKPFYVAEVLVETYQLGDATAKLITAETSAREAEERRVELERRGYRDIRYMRDKEQQVFESQRIGLRSEVQKLEAQRQWALNLLQRGATPARREQFDAIQRQYSQAYGRLQNLLARGRPLDGLSQDEKPRRIWPWVVGGVIALTVLRRLGGRRK